MSTIADREIDVVVNGEPIRVPQGCSVAEVVARFAPTVTPGRGTAVALNEEVIPASRWSQTTVAGGEHLELLQAVAGG